MNKHILIDKLTQLIEPIVLESEYELYHIELVSEQKDKYLRIYIDKNDGISLSDCEKVSKKVSILLDEKDPIPFSYYLEVSSPGIERTLYNDKHLSKYTGYNIKVALYEPLNGLKKYQGKLISFDENEIVIEANEDTIKLSRNKIASIKLNGDI